MNRKLGVVIGALVVLVLAIWFFAHRGSGAKKDTPKPATASKADPWANAKAKAGSDSDAKPINGLGMQWEFDNDPDGPLRLEGQVVDADKHGVGGADVWLSAVPPRTTKTEEDGSFGFDKVVGREYTLTATAKDMVGGPVEYKLTDASDPVVIQVVPGSSLVVGVTDEDGKAVAGADIKVAAEAANGAKTSADGTATIKPVRSGWVAVEVTASGYAPGHGYTQVAGGGQAGRVDVKLHKGYSVDGRVVDDHGKPVADARITTAGLWNIPGGMPPVRSDAKGLFTIKALPAGTHSLTARDAEHAPGRSAPITIADRPVSGIEIVMHDGGVLTGTVLDTANKGVAYATVRVGGEAQQMWSVAQRQVTTDKAGTFEIRGLDRAKLRVRAEGDAAASAVASVDLTSAAKKDIKLVLDVKGVIAGVVVDETGQAVAEIQVNAFPDVLGGDAPDALSLSGMSSATTDGAGKFTIRGLPDGGYRVNAARTTGTNYYELGRQGAKAHTGDMNVRVVLSAPGSIVGKVVVDGGDAPKLARAQVGYQPPATVGADGTFKLTDVSVGKHDIRLFGANFSEFIQRDVDVKPGKETDVGTITVTRGRRVTGKVVDASGTPVAGAHVKIGEMLFSMQGQEEQLDSVQEMYGNKSTTTDQDGTFALIGIPKKATNVMAEHPDRGRSDAIALPAGTDDPPAMTLKLHGFGTITGKVTSQGKPAPNVSITDTPKDGGTQMQMTQSDADGAFTLTKVAEGTHVVSAMQQNMMTASMKSTSANVQVTGGKTTNVTIDIPVGTISLVVEIKPLPNNKVDSAQVFLMHGVVAMQNGEEMMKAFMGGGVVGMQFWLSGKMKPFTELVPGDYSVCSVPITGDLSDATFGQRLQEHSRDLKVYCKQLKITPTPQQQTFTQELPSMMPLPTN